MFFHGYFLVSGLRYQEKDEYVYIIFNGLLSHHEKEGNPDVCNKLDAP